MDESNIVENFLETNSWHVGLDKKGAAIVLDGGGHRQPVKKVLNYWTIQKNSIDGYFPADEDTMQGILEELAPAPQKEEAKQNPEKVKMQQFMLKWDELFEFRIKENTPVVFKKGGEYEEQVQLKDSAKETRIEMISCDMEAPKIEECTMYVEYMHRDFVREFRDNALRNIKYDPSVKANGFKFCDWTARLFSIYGIRNTRLNRAMWRYMMHSIKRAAFGRRPCRTRIFYLIFSRTQGIGKSTLLEHLCDPFKHAFRNDATLSLFVDSSSIKSLAKGAYALVDFQELGLGKGANTVNRDDLSALMKRVITMSVEKGRELYTTTDTASLMNMVFASSTNLHISDVIQDTEYRRYYSFDSTLTKEEAINRDWSEVDEFFNTTLVDAYRFLNEDEEPDLPKDLWLELREAQAKYRTLTDIITMWTRETQIEILDKEEPGCMAIDRNSLFRMFSKYCEANNFHKYTSSRMQQLISSSLDILPVDREDGKSYYFIRKTANAK